MNTLTDCKARFDLAPNFTDADSVIPSVTVGDKVILRRKPQARLENWRLKEIPSGYALQGEVSHHPWIGDGELVSTSLVLKIDFVERTAETRNTTYLLETASYD